MSLNFEKLFSGAIHAEIVNIILYMHLENNFYFYIIKNVNWFIIFQSYNLSLILKINLSHQDSINYQISNTFHSKKTHLYFLINFFCLF